MEHRNRFAAGVDRDTSNQELGEGVLRDLENFRLLNLHGQGSILTQVKGNELKFQLDSGFIPLGATQHGGITFILSFNQATGEGEIGCYPAPNIDGLGGFTHTYRALRNWTAALDPATDPPRLPFTTTYFNLSCERQAEIEACISYDNSVNLYIADWRNPLRVINCGFDVQTGVYNDRQYWETGFNNQTDAFFESSPHAVFQTVTVQDGGAWKSGNTIFYARYKNASLDTTSFLIESKPAEVFSDSVSAGVIVDGEAEDVVCNKSIILDLINIDPLYAFIEIGFVRYTGATFVTGLIDRRYPITGSSMSITITGLETIIDLTPDDLIARKALEDCPRTIVQHERRLWGGNWKASIPDHPDLQRLSQQILVRPCDPDEQQELDDADFRSNTGTPYQNKLWSNLRDWVGYFRGEPYAFAIVWVLNGGKETIAYPVLGYDAWFDPAANTTNPRGILRMPSNMNVDYGYLRDRGPGQKIQVLGVKLDVSAALPSQWVLDNVAGFYLVRAERKPQLLAQAHVANCWFPDEDNGPWYTGSWIVTPPFNSGAWTANWIPEFHQGLASNPTVVSFPVPTVTTIINANGSVSAPAARKPSKFGAFSTDHFFNRGFSDSDNYVMVIQGRTVLNRFRMSTPYGLDRDPDNLWEQRAFTPGALVLDATNYGTIGINNVAEDTYSPTGGGFVSKFSEASAANIAAGLPFFYYGIDSFPGAYGSREMKQRNYLGLSTDTPGANATFDTTLQAGYDDVAVVNIYRIDPSALDITVLYEPSREFYSRISDFIPLADLPTIGSTVFYRGDCFVQRVYHRQMCSFNERSFGDTNGGIYYRHGNMLGVVQECKVNAAMRREDSTHFYYPESDASLPMVHASEHGSTAEADLLNGGYNKVLGLYARLGFDATLPAQQSRFPVRIKYSAERLDTGFADAYRQWSLAGKVDFDNKFGEITRIGVRDSMLYSIQQRATILHYVNDRAITGDGVGGAFVIGEGAVLNTKFKTISEEFGSQHQWSVIKGLRGDYFYDHNKRTMARISGGAVEPVSISKRFRQDLYDIAELISQETDLLHTLVDAPVCTGGVVGWHDPRQGDVGMTFIIPGEDCPYTLRTLVIDELRDLYMGKRTHYSPFYLNINNDLYSVNPGGMPWVTETPLSQFYLHDSDVAGRTRFYGLPASSMLAYSVNPMNERQKVFDSAALFASPIAPTSITVRTKAQNSVMDPFQAVESWKAPAYKEGAWRMPYLRADQVIGATDQRVSSYIRGEWMTVETRWSSDQDVEVALAITQFRPSFV